MTPRALLRELVYPLTELSVLLAILVFSLLATLAAAAGLPGIWLAVLVVPAIYRYLLLLLEARANGRPPPVAGVEVFNIAESFWSLTPLILHAAAIWIGFLLQRQVSEAAALTFVIAVFAVLPASLAILAVTRSPVESLNPAAWWRLMRACGSGYLLILAVPLRARRSVLTHAWGFISRGNASGGLKHIEQAIAEEPDAGPAWQWYFTRMLEWPSTDPALQLARSWLGWLLEQGRDVEALKLMTRCLRENPAFRPWPSHVEASTDLARRYDRDDLLQQGQSPQPP